MAPKDLAVRVLGTRIVSATVRRALRDRLRVVAYHDVPDADAFRYQLDDVLSRYQLVSGAEVAAAMKDGRPLPDRAVWITFDDGHASVVDHALPLLRARGVPATLFVCPGLVDSGESHWWEIIEAAVGNGWETKELPDGRYVPALKALSDSERRGFVDAARHHLDEAAVSGDPDTPVASLDLLQTWVDAGFELGNHTWDHPCLDRCDADEQRRQITEADRWLKNVGAFTHCRLFAYPNGDWTPESEAVLGELGYDVALLFDHQLAPVETTDPLRVSRVRLDTTASVERARAILSGGHSLVYRPESKSRVTAGELR